MSRFARPATEAGVIEPRSSPEPERPRGHAAFARLVGAVGMIALTAVLYWLLTDDSFRVTAADVRFEGLEHAEEAAVRAHLVGLERSPNVFRVRASEIVSDLRTLPEVAGVSATVTLPASVLVEVQEREPLFAWSDRKTAWLVDRTGMLFAALPTPAEGSPDPGRDSPGSAEESPGSTEEAASPLTATAPSSPGPGGTSTLPGDVGSGLPLVEDQRLPETPPAVGSHLPATDVAVMRQLLALTPELLGSRAESLRLRVDEYDGYVLTSDRGWQAVFGHYTPTLQPPEVVPQQVQCLRWLLAAEEKRLERVRLAVSDDGCGTYTLFGKPAEQSKP